MPPVFAAARALSEIALKPSPGGSMKPFCEQLTVTSTPQASCLYSAEPSEEMVSTRNSAGCLAASMALRISAIRLVTPVDVSLWTTITALMAWDLSCDSRSPIATGSAP